MLKRQLGNTGLEVSELGLGTWGLSGDGYGPVEEAQQEAVIDRAIALGITLFDTADCYGRGTMERKLGERVAKDSGCIIVTKIGTDRDVSPRKKRFDAPFLKERVDKCRERLGRDQLDLVLLHNPSERALARGVASTALEELKSAGSLRYWGVSVGSAAAARAAIDRGASVLELTYNAFACKDLQEIADLVREKGIGILARSVLAHGLLCGGWSRYKTFPAGDHRRERWTIDQLKKRIDQVSALRTLMGDDVQSTRAGALRFALHNEQVSSVVIGPRSTVQLDQLVREAGQGPPYLSEEKLTRLTTRLTELGVSG
ncbi:MAG TPA: aldo/keto reductase [Polyangiaceae bacterium]|nr:aldo/keto reductase [Polyangiaceae bacterium]